MLQRVLTIAFNTYRESVRARVLYGLGALALGTALYSIAIGAFTLQNAPRVVADLGATSISLYAIVVSVVLAGTSLHRELEQKTIFPILARPIRRSEYMVGKYLGTLLTLGVFVAFDAAAVLLIVSAMAGRSPALLLSIPAVAVAALGISAWKAPRVATWLPIPLSLMCVVVALLLAGAAPDEQRVVGAMALLSMLEVTIVAALATFFASFSSPFLSTIFTLGMVVVGRSAESLANMPPKTLVPQVKAAGQLLARIVPNLQAYVPARPLMTGESAVASLSTHLLVSTAQALAWAVGLLAVSSLIFRRRDFLLDASPKAAGKASTAGVAARLRGGLLAAARRDVPGHSQRREGVGKSRPRPARRPYARSCRT